MATNIDFNQISLRDTLDLAIFVEEEAKERYDEFAAQMKAHHSEEVAKFFVFMSGNEVKHAERLSEKRRSLFGDEPRTFDPSVLFDVEAPEYSKVRAFMPVQEALEVALQSEIKAYDFYNDALPSITDPGVRDMFGELRDQEAKHQELIRETMAKVPENDDFDPDDFVDEPAAQ
jgi:rubrerythrin